jgi:hypothetical protein
MVDPHIRLQNIALEHAELMARRSMSWSESTNRTTMFLGVVGAAVVGLALLAQATGVRDLALLGLLILSIVLLVGLTTLMRLVHLDEEDMRWVQGLNRLRHLRLELDPGLAPYLVTTPYDDFDSVLGAYGPEDSSWTHSLATLVVMVLVLNSVLVAAVAALIAVNLGTDSTVAVVVGLVAAVGFAVLVSVWSYRLISTAATRFRSVTPAPPRSDGVALSSEGARRGSSTD